MNRLKLKIRRKLSQLLRSLANQLEPKEPENFEYLTPNSETLPRKIRFPQVKVPPLGQKLQGLRVLTVIPQKISKFYQLHPLHHHPKFWLGLGLVMGMGSSAIAVGWNMYRLESSLPPSVDELLAYAPEGSLTIEAADGTILQQIGPIPHEQLKIWQYPDLVLKAFVAMEDRRFQEHNGVDFQGIIRAMFSNLQAGGVREGGSTITQQLTRMVFLTQERSFERKLKEIRLAQKIEEQYNKTEILERYLNLVYLGSGAYGVADAAWIYFSKPVEELTLPEIATLAGIVPAPSLYSPLENQQVAKIRRNLVLERMREEGYITANQAEQAIASPLNINPSPPKRLQRKAPYFTDYIQKELPKYVQPEVLKTGGIVVETTLNYQWQKAAEETVEQTISRYGRWQRFEQAAIVSIDPRNGQIKAMVGGNDFENNQYNRVTQAQRQPGSTFKAFVYAAAVAAGFSPNQGFLDAEYVVDGYKPGNYGDSYSGQYVSMRNALAQSLNVVAVKALVDVGWNPIITTAKKMGIQSELQPTYSLALGASEVNLLELTSAYGTLANQGVHYAPYGISRILDRKGNVLYQAQSQGEEALDEETSAIMTWMLQGVVTGGTGTPAQIGRPVAGKTGTSDKARDLWFIGYIPQVVTGIWLGNDDNKPTWGASTMSAMMWRQYMLQVVEAMPVLNFPQPPRQLDGREGIIEAEPIKPKSSYYNIPQPQPEENNQTTANTSNTNRARNRRRSNQNQARTEAPVENNSQRRTTRTTARSSQSVPNSQTVPVSSPKPQTSSSNAPASENVNVNVAPPAPPATHKEDSTTPTQ